MAPLTSSGVGLVEAAEDPRLFGLELSARQRDFLRTVEAHGTTIGCCGRQSGKTLLSAVAATHNALLRPDIDHAAGGSARHIISIANSKEQASILLAYVREFTERAPMLRRRVVQQRDDRVSFSNGVTIVAAPCTDRLTRGLRASLIVLDEAGWFIDGTDGPRTLERIYAALRPSLITFGKLGRTVVVSTPGEASYFQRLHAMAETGELGDSAAAFSAPTILMNPTVDATYLEAERAALGEAAYRMEFEAEFVAGGASAFFDEDLVRSVVGAYTELPASEGVGWVLGFDASFSSDPSGIAVVGRRKDDRNALVCAHVERWQPRRTRKERRAAKSAEEKREVEDVVLDRVARLSGQYGDAAVIADQHLSQVVRDGLKRRGVSQVVVQRWSGASVTEAFRALRSLMLADKISLPDDDNLTAELLRIRQRVRSGSLAIEIPRTTTSHCDVAVSVAAAVLRIEQKGVPRRARTFSSFTHAGPRLIPARELDELEAMWSAR
jgi:phage terminase large subunit-like protein